MNPSNIVQRSTTGDVTTADSYLRSVVLTAGSDAATVTVRAGGSGGTVILTVKAAAASTAATGDVVDVFCADGIHVTLAGTGPVASVVYA